MAKKNRLSSILFSCGMAAVLCLFALLQPFAAQQAHASAASAARQIQVVLGKQVMHFEVLAPYMTNDTVYVPLRECLQQMGYTVSYANRQIVYRKGGQGGVIDMTAQTLTTNEPGAQPRSLSFAEVRNSTAVPVRELSGMLNKRVVWDGEAQAVLIDSPYSQIAVDVPVLMYHYLAPADSITDKKNNAMLPVENFNRGMDYLHEQKYYTATLDELERYVRGELALPKKTVVITFDDGYQNNYIYAYPVMKKYGFHGALFPIGAHIPDQTAVFNPDVNTHLSFEEIEKCKDVFEFHSHTYDLHQKMTINGRSRAMTIDPGLLQKDIGLMKKIIDTPYICYPYGDFDERMLGILKQNGYRMGFTVRPGTVHPGDDPMTLNRLTVSTATDLAALLGGPPASSSGDADS